MLRRSDPAFWFMVIVFNIGLFSFFALWSCGPEIVKTPVPEPVEASVVGARSWVCSDGKSCDTRHECGDGLHCPKGKCCEVLSRGNDAGVAEGTRRVVGEPK